MVYPGTNLAVADLDPGDSDGGRDARRAEERTSYRLLFVGRDFVRKGGDLVVEALRHTREHSPVPVTLTVVGPGRWPLDTAPPPGVTFLGEVVGDRLRALFADHDVFVLPSRFEAFGIVFAEALAHGLPCVARDAYAMPEIVVPGETGALVGADDEDARAVADAVVAVLDDEALQDRCRTHRRSVAGRFSWTRAATEILDVCRGTLAGESGSRAGTQPPVP